MKFEALVNWALTPTKFVPDLSAARAKRDALRGGFVHVRAERLPEFCPPWVQGQLIGWRVHSPIDVTLTPLPQYEIPADCDSAESARATGQQQVWMRGDAAIAVSAPPWLNGFEYLQDGRRQNMFIPNGLGTVEWRLGWTVRDPVGFGLLIVPTIGQESLGVEWGYLSLKALERLEEKGLSIAVRPDREIRISRGQEIARLIPISPEALVL